MDYSDRWFIISWRPLGKFLWYDFSFANSLIHVRGSNLEPWPQGDRDNEASQQNLLGMGILKVPQVV